MAGVHADDERLGSHVEPAGGAEGAVRPPEHGCQPVPGRVKRRPQAACLPGFPKPVREGAAVDAAGVAPPEVAATGVEEGPPNNPVCEGLRVAVADVTVNAAPAVIAGERQTEMVGPERRPGQAEPGLRVLEALAQAIAPGKAVAAVVDLVQDGEYAVPPAEQASGLGQPGELAVRDHHTVDSRGKARGAVAPARRQCDPRPVGGPRPLPLELPGRPQGRRRPRGSDFNVCTHVSCFSLGEWPRRGSRPHGAKRQRRKTGLEQVSKPLTVRTLVRI